MATEKLEIQIGADIVEVTKSIDQLERELQGLGKSLKSAVPGSQAFNDLSKAFTRQQVIIAGVNKEIAKTTPTLGKLGNATGQATQSLTNFSRVVQDAPFGIIGIANNIDPLISSFTQLKASTGSAGAAFKALAGSLIGPAGIALAISSVTSLLIAYAQRQQKVKKETEEATKDTDSYVRKLSEQKEEITALVRLAKDESQAQDTRARALQRLNDIIPDTVGKLTQQNIATAQGTNIIREYVKALEAQATAELLVGRIAENNVKLFDNRTNTLKEVDRINKEIEATEKRIARQNQAGNFTASTAARQKIIELEKERTRVQEAGRTSANGLIADNENIRLSYEKLLPAAIKIEKLSTDRAKKLKDEVDILKEYREAIRLIQFNETALGVDLLNQKIDVASKTFQDFIEKGINPQSAAFKTLQTDLNNYLDAIKKIPKDLQRAELLPLEPSKAELPKKADRTSSLVITPEALRLQGQYSLQLDEVLEKLRLQQELVKSISDTITGGLNAGIDQFFNAIANNQDPFEALAQSVKRLVAELAAAVVKALILKAVTAAFTGGTSAGAGAFSGLFGSSVVRGDQLRLLTFLRG